MEQDSITLPVVSFHRSHRPANANRESSCMPKWKGCFSFPLRDHSKNPSAGSKHRRLTKASRKAGLLATVSARALVVLNPILASAAQDGIRPQRASEKCRSGFGRILANDSDRLRRGDVVARLPIDLVFGFEVFLDQLLAPGQTVAATHFPILRSSNNVTEPSNWRDTHSALSVPESYSWP